MKKNLWALTLITILMGIILTVVPACSQPSSTSTPTPAAPKTSAPSPTTAPAPAATATQAPPSSAVAAPEKPKIINIVTHAAGTGSYIRGVAFADAIKKVTGIETRVISIDAVVAKWNALKNKEADVSVHAMNHHALLAEGKDYFPQVGPQKVRIVWLESDLITGLAVRADSGIMKISDLKGKKFGLTPGVMGQDISNLGQLAFGGLSKSDIVPVEYASTTAAFQAVIDGNVDTFSFSIDSSQLKALEASSHGMRWLEMPASDTQGWKRAQAVAPFLFPIKATNGPGIAPGKTVELAGLGQLVHGYDSSILPDNVAYWIARGIAEGYQYFKATSPTLTLDTIDAALDSKHLPPYPYHSGSIIYFKQVGKWTPQLEQWQQNALSLENQRLAAFKK